MPITLCSKVKCIKYNTFCYFSNMSKSTVRTFTIDVENIVVIVIIRLFNAMRCTQYEYVTRKCTQKPYTYLCQHHHHRTIHKIAYTQFRKGYVCEYTRTKIISLGAMICEIQTCDLSRSRSKTTLAILNDNYIRAFIGPAAAAAAQQASRDIMSLCVVM